MASCVLRGVAVDCLFGVREAMLDELRGVDPLGMDGLASGIIGRCPCKSLSRLHER